MGHRYTQETHEIYAEEKALLERAGFSLFHEYHKNSFHGYFGRNGTLTTLTVTLHNTVVEMYFNLRFKRAKLMHPKGCSGGFYYPFQMKFIGSWDTPAHEEWQRYRDKHAIYAGHFRAGEASRVIEKYLDISDSRVAKTIPFQFLASGFAYHITPELADKFPSPDREIILDLLQKELPLQWM